MSNMKMNAALLVAACATGYAFIKSGSLIGKYQKENPVVITNTDEYIAPTININDQRETFFPNEFHTIREAAIRNKLDPNSQLFSVLLAIRKAENGRAGREFGVMHPKALDTDLDTQAGWAAATVVKNYDRWLDEDKTDRNFFEYLGSRYAPIGAENDPTGLNKHWVLNVEFWFGVFENAVNDLNENMPWTPISKNYASKFDFPVVAELHK